MKKVIYPFSIGIYYMILLIFIIVFTSYHFLQKRFPKEDFGNPMYNLLVSSLGSPFEKVPRSTFVRFLATSWIILFFLLRTSYSSFLYHFIRSDIKLVQPNDIPSVLANYRILSTDMMYDLLVDQPEIQSKLIHEDVGKSVIFEKAFFLEPELTAFIMNIEMCGYVRKTSKRFTSNLYIVPQTVLAQYYVIYMKKNSILKTAFDGKILLYHSSGLVKKWEQEYVDIKEINKYSNDITLQQMNFEDVSGIFVIWAGFLGLCLLVFVFELISLKFHISVGYFK